MNRDYLYAKYTKHKVTSHEKPKSITFPDVTTLEINFNCFLSLNINFFQGFTHLNLQWEEDKFVVYYCLHSDSLHYSTGYMLMVFVT